MAIDSRYKMSQERLDTLKEELHYLETTREKEVAELIKEARSFGKTSYFYSVRFFRHGFVGDQTVVDK